MRPISSTRRTSTRLPLTRRRPPLTVLQLTVLAVLVMGSAVESFQLQVVGGGSSRTIRQTFLQQYTSTADASPSDAKSDSTPAPAKVDQQVQEAPTAMKSQGTKQKQKQQLDLPWNDSQQWALRDKLSRFSVQIPVENDMRLYVLWRNLVQDTPELQGYPLSFLVERLQEMKEELPVGLQRAEKQILPYLDHFLFENSGGLTGNVYGVEGVAEGTRIQTTPVGDVEVTVPKGFVRAGSIIYELGQPQTVSLATNGSSQYGKDWQRNGKELAASMLASKSDLASTSQQSDGALDPEIINLAGLTAIVLAGATAAETLSHHLTVNIFWV